MGSIAMVYDNDHFGPNNQKLSARTEEKKKWKYKQNDIESCYGINSISK